jgi:nucleotide-binding universal stress UspA family protein
VEVSARAERKVDLAVSSEAQNGYDILFIGLAKMHNANGAFAKDVDRVAKGFGGPLVLVSTGENDNALRGEALNILVPVNGTEASRRGAEMALAISSGQKSKVTALYVANRAASSGVRRVRNVVPRGRSEKAVLDDIGLLAKRYGHDDLGSAVKADVAPNEATVAEAKKIGASVIVIGANRRVGEQLYLGNTVECILREWKGAIVIVVT